MEWLTKNAGKVWLVVYLFLTLFAVVLLANAQSLEERFISQKLTLEDVKTLEDLYFSEKKEYRQLSREECGDCEVFVYETSCKGYRYVDYITKDSIGFGVYADELTYSFGQLDVASSSVSDPVGGI